MNYIESIDYLNSFINFERLPDQQFNTREEDIDRFKMLLEKLGNPHLQYPVIHIAGTKGKGSVAAILASVLRAANLKVGLYTSPHLITVRERIRTNDKIINKNEFAVAVDKIRNVSQKLDGNDPVAFRTVFEHLTAVAFTRFAKKRVDVAIIETGLGGKLDATNVVKPILSIITPIGFDHTEILGDTISEIAADKAHIIKPNIPVVCSAQKYSDAIEQIQIRADKMNAPLTMVAKYSDYLDQIDATLKMTTFQSNHSSLNGKQIKLQLLGEFQLDNVSTVMSAVEQLMGQGYDIPVEAILKGFRVAKWKGRLEYIDGAPPMILDGAHNDLAMETLCNAIDKLSDKPLRVVMSSMRSKPFARMMEILSNRAVKFYLAPIQFPKSLTEEELSQFAKDAGVDAVICKDIPTAFESARNDAQTDEIVLATGSLYLVGEVMRHMKGDPAPPSDGSIDSRV